MKPEEIARQKIDQLLEAAGWTIQDYKDLNLGASLGVAIREFPLKSGFADYLLFVDRKAIGVIEAKPYVMEPFESLRGSLDRTDMSDT